MLGEVIHGYRVDRALSADKGGFGDVFFATHVESGAEAVVKVLKPEMSALRDIVTRFFNEARAAASIHHPGIVQIHNVGYHRDRAYLLMERLRGDDLETRLTAGPLPIDRALVFMRQAAGAIGAAHERGIVHRDLKPANLFVVADPDVIGGERVKVLDFGIAKLTADSGAGKTQGVFGTPAYMSPEQCASAGAVDARADLYSLGCIFYELLCGRPPFGQGGIELIASHLRDTPPPPRAIAPWIPPPIEQVILQLLEKQPDRRFQSCAALIAAIDAAAAASGIPMASQPSLPPGGIPGQPSLPPGMASQPRLPSGNVPAYGVAPTTLGSAAGVAATLPAKKRGAGLWIALGAVVVAGGAAAAFLALPARSAGPGSGSGTGQGSVVATDTRDAGVPDAAVAAAPPDAASVAAATPDAATRPPKDAQAAASSEAELAEKLVKEGNDAMYADDFRKARTRYQEAVAHVPQAGSFLNLAVADFQLGLLDEAATAARAALAASPSDAVAGKTKKLLTKIKEAAESQGITLHPPISASESGSEQASDPGEAEKLNQRGKSEALAGRYESALTLFRRAYELAPQAKVLLNIGTMEYQLGRCNDARRTLQRVAPTWPNDAAAKKAEQLLERIGTCR